MMIQHSHECLPLVAFVDNVEHIARIAAEPVESRDYQFVAGTKKLYDGGQLVAPFAARC
jgi:hypothetical protein